jgi:formylglycine-generating enzyme required for sulfatase activity
MKRRPVASHALRVSALRVSCWLSASRDSVRLHLGRTIAYTVLALAGAHPALADPTPSNLDALLSELETKTAALVASGRVRLDSLSGQERISAPPTIWRVRAGVTEFKDCASCPPLIVIPAGEFTMGSPPSERYRGAETQHRVTIAYPFAVSKFEVTFEEWDACVKDDGCAGYKPGDEGWGRGRRPVMNISWENAKAYAAWLSRKTGKSYRLLSESEWEYAARAGTTTPFAYGNTMSPGKADYNGSTGGSKSSKLNRQKTLPVGGFRPNRFGLHDMHGNVSEWVEDCWHDEYNQNTPMDGSAWLDGDCGGRVVRGGSWEDSQAEIRSAARTGGAKADQFYTDGLRIARDL